MFRLAPAVGGDAASLDVDTFTVTTTIDSVFSQGATLDLAGTPIHVGVTAGQIDASSSLTIAAVGAANDLTLSAGLELYLDDLNQAGSTWTAPAMKLSETAGEWDSYKTSFGEVSLLNAITQAATSGANRTKTVAVATANVPANTNVTGAGGSPNLDAILADYSAVSFVNAVDIYLNGELLRNGANALANNDVYPGTSPANGDLMFEFKLKGTGSSPDVLTMIVWN